MALLGLARKAGKLVIGDRACRKVLAKGEAKLLVLAGDGSERTRRAFIELGVGACVPVCLLAGKEELGRQLGRDQVAVAAVTETSLARAVLRALPDTGEEKLRG